MRRRGKQAMRIAMFTNNYKPFVGGVPISVERLAEGLRMRGHLVDIFAPYYKNQVPEEGVYRFKIFKKVLKGGYTVPNMFDRAIKKKFVAGKYDIIHTHHPMLMGHTAMHLARHFDVPLTFTYHTRYEEYLHVVLPEYANKDRDNSLTYKTAEKIVKKHNRAFANKCNMVFAPSPEIRDYLIRENVHKRVEVLPTGLADADFVYDQERAKALRDELDCPNVFICVSRLEKEKNFSFMLRALAKLHGQWTEAFRVMIIGDGTEREALIAEAAALGLADIVHFVGRVPHEDLVNYYNASDLFLFSSQSETQGIVLLEGMAAGLPVVAVEGSGVNDIVKNGLNGQRTPLNTQLWADQVQAVMSSTEGYEKMRLGAYETAGEYRASSIAGIVERHYQAILEEVPGHVALRYDIN